MFSTSTIPAARIPALSGCRFDDSAWQFGGEAADTIGFLSCMYQGGFNRLIEVTFHEIRCGALIGQPAEPKPQPSASASAAPVAAGLMKPLRIFRGPKQEQ